MGYVLRDGKRYYQDSAGNLVLDNVSQTEADRRETRSAWRHRTNDRSKSGLSKSGSLVLGVLIFALLLLIGAFIHNQRFESPAAKAIDEYMNGKEGTAVSSSEISDGY